MASFRLFLTGHRPEPITNPSGAVIMGLGTESYPATSEATADQKWISLYLKDPATSGTSRGMYLYLDVSAGAGGEALRAVTMVENNTPADTVNGAHISLKFGTSAGNVTGEAHAGRFTIHVPVNRTIGGTWSPIQSEIFGDGSNSGNVTGTETSFMRFIVHGHADVISGVNARGLLFSLQGPTDTEGGIFRVVAPTTLAASLRVKVGSTLYYLPLYSGLS